MNMPRVRSWVPVLGFVALAALFLSLPETPFVSAICKSGSCSSSDPYLPLLGAGYFALLIAAALLFPAFPGPRVARAGLTWAVLLTAALTYLQWPGWCALCLVGHACNVLIWATWALVPPTALEASGATRRERLYLVLFAPVAVVALFSSLNLTFMAYRFKVPTPVATSLQPGDALPDFATQTTAGRSLSQADAAQTQGLVINFVSPACPHCERQLPILEAVAAKLAAGSYRFINVSPTLPPDLLQRAPAGEWVEDKGDKLRDLFHVLGTPVLFVVGTDGKIANIFVGVPEQLEAQLLTSLVKPGGPGSGASPSASDPERKGAQR